MQVELTSVIVNKARIEEALRRRLVELFETVANAKKEHDNHYHQKQPAGSKWDRLTRQAHYDVIRDLQLLPSEAKQLKYKVKFDEHDVYSGNTPKP